MTSPTTSTGRIGAIESALTEATRRYADRHPRSRELFERARSVLPGGTTRSVLLHPPFPLRVAHASGSVFEDVDGHTYVDLLGNYSAALFGHAHPAIVDAVRSALETVGNGVHNTDEVELALALTKRFPTMQMVRFTNSGTEANIMAVATARLFTGRQEVLVFRGGYHGGVLSFPVQPGTRTLNLPFPTVVGPYNDVPGAESLIDAHADSLACVLVEPMLGATGCLPATPEFMHALEDATRRISALLIVDEVMTSRNGPNGMQETFGVRGDLMTLGKYIAGGMSFGAFGGRADVMRAFDPGTPGAVPHSGTFNNNVASMAAGRVVMDALYTSDIAEEHSVTGERLRQEIRAVLARTDADLSITGTGSLMNMHGTKAPIVLPDDLLHADDRLKTLMFLLLLEYGYYLAPRGYIALSLALTEDQRRGLVAAVEQVIIDNPVLRTPDPVGGASP
jgi:glutamate-1-semialdehyde 2,1-aminomutase